MRRDVQPLDIVHHEKVDFPLLEKLLGMMDHWAEARLDYLQDPFQL